MACSRCTVCCHAGSTLSPAPATKSTTLYVGKIAATISDDVIKTLLEACGPVKSWKPMQDPETNKSKGFGFCEYETAEGVLRALRLLHNLSVDGQELLLKCNTATQRYIDDYQAVKTKEANSKAAVQKPSADTSDDKDAKADAAEERNDDKEDDAVLAKIMGLVSDRAAQQSGPNAADQANDFLNDVLPPPPRRDRQSSAKEPASSSKDRERDHASKERERGISADMAAERQIEKERAREKREAELRKAELDRAMERVYEKKLREWEHTERSGFLPCPTSCSCRTMQPPLQDVDRHLWLRTTPILSTRESASCVAQQGKCSPGLSAAVDSAYACSCRQAALVACLS